MMQKTLDEDVLKSWIGRTETATDTFHAAHADLLRSTLGLEGELTTGSPLPPAWHWLYFSDATPLDDLGPDGHPALGDFLPPIDLPRRMWAGSRLTFNHPILLGDRISKTSMITKIAPKSGQTGRLCFVTVTHELKNDDGQTCISEEQNIVYRQDPTTDASPSNPMVLNDTSQETRQITPTTPLLFRYSALTFNTHKIHYDRNYCKTVEGYPGLVFHGPLTATLLAQCSIALVAGHQSPQNLTSIEFKAVAPLYDIMPFNIHHNGTNKAWANTPQGNLAMSAEFGFTG